MNRPLQRFGPLAILTLTLLPNQGGGLFSYSPLLSVTAVKGAGPHGLAVANFNGDFALDIATANANSNQIVLEVLPGGVFAINTEKQTAGTLQTRLKEIYDQRPEKVIFVKGAPNVKYADVIFAMDVSRGAGVKVIGIPPKDTPGAAPARKS